MAILVSAYEIIRFTGEVDALRKAFEATSADFIFLLRGGIDETAIDFERYLTELSEQKADVVVGSKRHPESKVDYSHGRRLLSRAYFAFVKLFIGVPITDTEAGIFLYRRETLKYALERMLVKSNAFELELLAISTLHGAKIVEAPVIIANAIGGKVAGGVVKGKVIDTLAIFYRARILRYYQRCLIPRQLDHEPLVSIVIPCPNKSWMLEECLKAIAEQTYRNYEVIVLDDEKTGKIRPAEKRNLGIKEAKGEIVAFIDDDAYPDKHWLEYAVRYFGEDSVGAVGGPGVTPPGDKWLARIGGLVYDNILVSGNYRYRYKAGGVRRDVEDYPSCNLFVRKDLLDKIGGYRTDFWPGEDTLLCKGIIDNFKRIIYDPWVIVFHHRRPLFMPHLRQLGRYGFHRGYFVKRFPSNSLRLSYFIPTFFVLGMAFGYWLWPLYAFYLALVLFTSFNLKPHYWLLTAFGVVLSHLTYGIRFAHGLCAKKAPCEFIGKDHA